MSFVSVYSSVKMQLLTKNMFYSFFQIILKSVFSFRFQVLLCICRYKLRRRCSVKELVPGQIWDIDYFAVGKANVKFPVISLFLLKSENLGFLWFCISCLPCWDRNLKGITYSLIQKVTSVTFFAFSPQHIYKVANLRLTNYHLQNIKNGFFKIRWRFIKI